MDDMDIASGQDDFGAWKMREKALGGFSEKRALRNVRRKISAAAARGKFTTEVELSGKSSNEIVRGRMVNALRERGFNVYADCDISGKMIKLQISWETKNPTY